MISNKKKAVIHIAQAKVGMSDVEYRGMLGRFGVETSKDLTPATFDLVMKHFESLGFKRRWAKKTRKLATSKERLLGKIKALCADMDLKQGYADGIAGKMFGVDLIAWCDADQLRKIVAALVYHKKRKSHAKAPRR